MAISRHNARAAERSRSTARLRSSTGHAKLPLTSHLLRAVHRADGREGVLLSTALLGRVYRPPIIGGKASTARRPASTCWVLALACWLASAAGQCAGRGLRSRQLHVLKGRGRSPSSVEVRSS